MQEMDTVPFLLPPCPEVSSASAHRAEGRKDEATRIDVGRLVRAAQR